MDLKIKSSSSSGMLPSLAMKFLPNILLLLLLLSTMTTIQCQSEEDPEEDPEGDASMNSSDEPSTSAIVEPLLRFTSKLYGTYLSSENVILSPISIHKALNLVLLGADKSSQTERELIDVLGYTGKSHGDIVKYHEAYSKIVAKFKEITRISQEVYKNRKNDDAHHFQRHQNPPILDLFNMVITKDKGQVRSSYSEKSRKYYDSSIVQLDDKRPEIKKTLLERTDKWSKDAEFQSPILSSGDLSRQFSAILLSAIRVKANWLRDRFYESDGKNIFHQYGLADKKVDGKWLSLYEIVSSEYLELTTADKAKYKMLHGRLTSSPVADQYNELASLNCHVIQLPLEGHLSFTIFEPLNVSGSGGELKKLANRLFSPARSSTPSSSVSANSTTILSKILSLLDSKYSGSVTSIGFPKFDFESEINLKPVLHSLGLKRAFDQDRAEISNMTSVTLAVDTIKHKAVIDVNKDGIKAAGVTVVHMVPLSAIMYTEPINIEVNNPFIFMLRYKKLPLFIGQLVKLD